MSEKALFEVGNIVDHILFGYRGVVINVDDEFMHSDVWYEQSAKSRPPKNRPWYHVLVHNGVQSTYVAQRNLRPARSNEQVNHPSLADHFKSFDGQAYCSLHKVN